MKQITKQTLKLILLIAVLLVSISVVNAEDFDGFVVVTHTNSGSVGIEVEGEIPIAQFIISVYDGNNLISKNTYTECNGKLVCDVSVPLFYSEGDPFCTSNSFSDYRLVVGFDFQGNLTHYFTLDRENGFYENTNGDKITLKNVGYFNDGPCGSSLYIKANNFIAIAEAYSGVVGYIKNKYENHKDNDEDSVKAQFLSELYMFEIKTRSYLNIFDDKLFKLAIKGTPIEEPFNEYLDNFSDLLIQSAELRDFIEQDRKIMCLYYEESDTNNKVYCESFEGFEAIIDDIKIDERLTTLTNQFIHLINSDPLSEETAAAINEYESDSLNLQDDLTEIVYLMYYTTEYVNKNQINDDDEDDFLVLLIKITNEAKTMNASIISMNDQLGLYHEVCYVLDLDQNICENPSQIEGRLSTILIELGQGKLYPLQLQLEKYLGSGFTNDDVIEFNKNVEKLIEEITINIYKANKSLESVESKIDEQESYVQKTAYTRAILSLNYFLEKANDLLVSTEALNNSLFIDEGPQAVPVQPIPIQAVPVSTPTESDVIHLKNKFSNIENDFEKIEEELRDLRDLLSNANLKKETKKIDAVEEQIQEELDDLKDVVDDLDRLEDDLKDTKDEVADAQMPKDLKDKLETDLKHLEDDVEDLQDDINELKDTFNDKGDLQQTIINLGNKDSKSNKDDQEELHDVEIGKDKTEGLESEKKEIATQEETLSALSQEQDNFEEVSNTQEQTQDPKTTQSEFGLESTFLVVLISAIGVLVVLSLVLAGVLAVKMGR